jgi:hypothetical protein
MSAWRKRPDIRSVLESGGREEANRTIHKALQRLAKSHDADTRLYAKPLSTFTPMEKLPTIFLQTKGYREFLCLKIRKLHGLSHHGYARIRPSPLDNQKCDRVINTGYQGRLVPRQPATDTDPASLTG